MPWALMYQRFTANRVLVNVLGKHGVEGCLVESHKWSSNPLQPRGFSAIVRHMLCSTAQVVMAEGTKV